MDKNNKKVTLNSLAESIELLTTTVKTGFKKIDTDIESLALMTADSFAAMTEDVTSLQESVIKIETKVIKLETKVIKLEAKVIKLDGSVTSLQQGMERLEQGQENIQLRVDSLAPHFEVKELTQRVKNLENKAGIQYAV